MKQLAVRNACRKTLIQKTTKKYNNNKRGGGKDAKGQCCGMTNTLDVHREEHRVLSNLKQKQCPILYLQSSSG